MNIYDIRKYGTALFLAISVGVVAYFLYVSNNLVKDLAAQERERMEIWADATKQLADISSMPGGDAQAENIDFLFSIIQRNHNIPVILTDDDGNILDHRNFDLPEPPDTLDAYHLSAINERYLRGKLADLEGRQNVIHIIISADNLQHLYYDDSKLLRRLSLYPYVQLLVMLAFIAVVYFAVSSTKRAEQNKVWVGLSKETAHQLGTPISSLMAWMEIMRASGADPEMVAEMDKDVNRLSTIASRFSKIGSQPQMEDADLNETVFKAASYMATRISARINLSVELCDGRLPVRLSAPLVEWVMENLIKNAVDAMEGTGSITVATSTDGGKARVTVTDTGKGIPRKNQKTVFNPGFTTKKRGWGLGLTLAKRIIEQYHGGRIFVAWSEPGKGTSFEIDLPLRKEDAATV
ncbi:MAG: ATP-binding protein [[Clostridium] fimetarium]|nr:ATP-binding protein [Alistipes timonensis]MCM1405564.1 ATP-binding protein [[Clostridium] fimetarium]